VTPWEALQWVAVIGLAWFILAMITATTIALLRGSRDTRIKRYADENEVSLSVAESILRSKGRIK
jgi:hypothetical protein